jgi:hypothetical protein
MLALAVDVVLSMRVPSSPGYSPVIDVWGACSRYSSYSSYSRSFVACLSVAELSAAL